MQNQWRRIQDLGRGTRGKYGPKRANCGSQERIIHDSRYQGWGGDALLLGGPESYLKKDRYAIGTEKDANENKNNKVNEHIAVCG